MFSRDETHPTVITPHAGELGRLLGIGAKEVVGPQARCGPHAAAEKHRCCVLLKGSDTLVVEGESVAVNSTGNVALATAGTGDVLSGVIGALLSRGMDAYEAARAGAWAHGRAAELWLEETGWPAESLVATDLLGLPAAGRRRAASEVQAASSSGTSWGPRDARRSSTSCRSCARSCELDAVVANAENSAPAGRGITRESGSALLSVADFLTLGNHAFDAEGYRGVPRRGRQSGASRQLRREDSRAGAGAFRGWRRNRRRHQRARAGLRREDAGSRLSRPPIGPSRSWRRAAPTSCSSTPTPRPRARSRRSATISMGGRRPCSGTHTHVPTADLSILPGGTAYVTDVGMTGCKESIIGFDREDFLALFLGTGVGSRSPPDGPVVLQRRARRVRPRRAGGRQGSSRSRRVEALARRVAAETV